MARRIYLASSWRNQDQPAVVAFLRNAGHEVYDFRHPTPGNDGFSWRQIGEGWQSWSLEEYRDALDHPVAQAGYTLDRAALDWCDTCVCLLPCGRSAHLEAGYAIGRGKPTFFVLSPDRFEPELMYLLGDDVLLDLDELSSALAMLP